MKKIKKINLQTMQRWILKNNCYFYNILWFNQSKMQNLYIERNNSYDYNVITNFLNIHKKKQKFSPTFDEQEIEMNIFSLSTWHKMCLNWSIRLKFKTHFMLQQQREIAKHKKIEIFVDFWRTKNRNEHFSLDFLTQKYDLINWLIFKTHDVLKKRTKNCETKTKILVNS